MPFVHAFSLISANLEFFVSRGGYILLFIFTLLEGLPIIGMFVPGHIAIILGGFFAKIGVMNLWVVLSVSIVGAILGDYAGFMIGRKFGMSFVSRLMPYIGITDLHIDKARKLLSKHTGKAMIIGRFSPVTRALMPFLVGSSPAPVKKFWLFNIIGGASWAISSVLLGYIFGAGYHAIAAFTGKYVFFAIVLGVIIIWGYKFVNSRFHIFARYELGTLTLNIISLWVLAETIQDAWSNQSFMANFDIWVNLFMNTHVSPFVANVASWISLLGGTYVTIGAGLILALILAFKKKWRLSAISMLSIGLTSFFLGTFKEFFMRLRPENALQFLTDYSFPSGHAGLAAAFFIVFAYVCALNIKSWIKRESAMTGCILAIIVIGVSRIVLNVHWSSDVIAGWALGTFLATASILFVRYVGTFFVKRS